MKHLVDQLLGATRVALPRPSGTTVVICGRRIDDVRQIRGDEDDAASLAQIRREVRRARDNARYEARKHDPAFKARRAEWRERNREKVRAYKREYDQRTKEHQRQIKTDWARRNRLRLAEAKRASSKAYYELNRERILADKRAARAAKAAIAASAREAG